MESRTREMKRAGEVTPHTTPSKIRTWEVGETPEKRRGPLIPTQASPTKQLQKRSSSTMDNIKTYVFFDLECTGLIRNDDIRFAPVNNRSFEKNEDYYNHLNNLCITTREDDIPYITEMSFVAINRDTFNELKEERKKLSNWNEGHPESQQPLVKYIATNTHTRLLNPRMTENEWTSYEKRRGFDRNGVLVHPRKICERSNSFAEEWPAVIQFLSSLPKPAVLIGHNALHYDLRVIYGEMTRHQLLDLHPIPKDVFFVDTLLMSKQIEEKMAKEMATVCKYIKFPKIPEQQEPELIVIEDSQLPQNAPDVRPPAIVNGVPARDHPANFIDWSQFSIALKRRMKMSGFVRTSTGWTYKNPASNRFSLGVLHEELVGGNFVAHFAQQDAEALMHVCLSYGDDFSEFTDNFAANIPF